ncbi:MAG TPA: PxKF domain-containing protein [Chloroflexia bacterium]
MIGKFMRSKALKPLRVLTAVSMLLAMLGPLGVAQTFALSITSVQILSGSASTFSPAPGTVYSMQGGTMTLIVATSPDTKCVEVNAGSGPVQRMSNPAGQTGWSFPITGRNGDGPQVVVATAFTGIMGNGNCNGSSTSASTQYIRDNTGPTVTAALAPAPNGAGWNNSNVSITWSATDNGAGMSGGQASGPAPATDSQTTNTANTMKSATAKDAVGNVGTGSVSIKLDKNAPSISGSRSPAANAFGWNNTDVVVSFTCADSVQFSSGIKSCTSPVTLSAENANQSVTGTAVDVADNSANATVNNINIDKTAPSLSGAPTAPANVAGWYNGPVTIHWTASDALSGVDPATAPADDTISGEGTNQTVNASVSDKAGNSTMATSGPGVNIDTTKPNTTASAPAGWNNTNVIVALNALDNLSGLAATYYNLDNMGQQTGNSVNINADGTHTLVYWSVDNAGNIEDSHSIQVLIDQTSPAINHSLSPSANSFGWNNSNVIVTFTCTDTVSGIAPNGCTGPVTVTTEGANQIVTGTALDNAGNTASDPASVSIDKSAPTINGDAMPAANANGWNNTDVTVSFTCNDDLSGVASCPGSTTLNGEGAGQSVMGTATDKAGNSSEATISDINIDKTDPSLSGAPATQPNGAGWYNSDVTVKWTCSDTLSTVDGPCPADSTIGGEGTDLTASASVSDKAGNTTNATSSPAVNIDQTAPSITGAATTSPNGAGWYNGPVTIHFTCFDGLSGIAVCPADVVLSGDGANQVASGTAYDNAGNSASFTLTGINIDQTAPVINGSRTPGPNTYGWNNTDVTVSFSCSDVLSGVASCSGPTTLSSEGAGQSVSGTVYDLAGNSASATVGSINIDKTAPGLSLPANITANSSSLSGAVVNYTATASDALSGFTGSVHTTTPGCSPASGATFAAGTTTTVNCASTDQAGNTGTGSFTVTVNPFSFQGFLQPVDNLPVANTVRGGSTVPLKWKLFLYTGGPEITDVASVAAGWPKLYTSTSCASAPSDEIEITATGSTTLRYDTSGQQFIYNWKTPTGPGCYRVEVKFTDGRAYSALFATR